jgi:hypothetical protein
LTLSDNSKLIVHAKSKQECERTIESFKQFIDPNFLRNSHLKIGERKGRLLKVQLVVPTIIRFFAQGQKNTVPNWVADIRG